MAEKRIFSRLNRWWRSPDQPGADDPLAPGAEPEGGEAVSDPGFGNDADSPHQSPRDLYTSDVLPPEVEAAGQEALEAEIENLTRKLEKKQQHIESLLEQRNELHQQLRAAQDTISALEAQLKERQSQGEAATAARLEPLEEANRHLIAERDAALNRLQEAESKLAQNQAAHESALRERDARLTALEADLAARSQSAEESGRSKEELSQRIAALEQDLARARASQQELGQARQEAQHALSLAVEADEARKRAEERVVALEAELAARQAQAEELERQAAAPPPQPAPAPAQVESIDLTSELEQVAAASPAVPEPAPHQPAQPAEAVAPQPPLGSFPMPEESSEPAIFEFSAAPEETPPEPVAQEPVPEPPERKKKLILIAEDDPSIRRLVELALQKAGLDVITAEDGEEAFQKAIAERPDAILTDMMMPRMNGMELTSKLKKTPLTARIPVGFLTAQRELEYYKGALDLGSALYVTKPFRPDNLVTLVNLLLSGKKKPRGSGKK